MISETTTDEHGESSIKPAPPASSDVGNDADGDANIVADPASLLPDLPVVPRKNATLIGGRIEKLDRVRDQLTIGLFGGGKMKVLFDPRTHVYLKGADGSAADLHEGERVYLDTILDGSTVFARSIRVKRESNLGESQGVVLRYRADRGELTLRDAISPSPIRIRLNASTQFTKDGRSVSADSFSDGCLIGVRFDSQPGSDVAREISILAVPGARYTFAGQIAHLDLSSGLLVLNSSTDRKTYEIRLDPSSSRFGQDENLQVGATVTVVANFEGSRYVARNVTVISPAK